MRLCVIVGATSGIAQEFAKKFAKLGDAEIVLIGRNKSKLTSISQDLTIRYPGLKTHVQSGEMITSSQIEKHISHSLKWGSPQVVLIAQGTLPSQAKIEENLQELESSIAINVSSQALFAEGFANALRKTSTTIAVIGSVAGDRGRKSNYSYGAAKAFIDTYVRGLQHRFFHSPLNILLVKPGPTQTAMTINLPNSEKFASASEVSQDILTGIVKKKKVVYTPKKWRAIMFVVRLMPEGLFNRTNF